MIKTQKIYFKPNQEIKEILDSQSKISCWLYNQLIDWTYSLDRIPSKYTIRNQVLEIIKDNPFVKTLFSSVYKNVGLRVADSWKRYFTGQNEKPKFASWKQNWFSLYYEEAESKGVKITRKQVILSLGKDEHNKQIKISFELNEKIKIIPKTFRICKDVKGYYVIITNHTKTNKVKTEIKTTCAIDPNHKNLCYILDSNGNSTEVQNLKLIKYWNKRIDDLKSKRDKCKRKSQKVELTEGKFYFKSSRRYHKYDLALTRAYNCMREQKKQAIYSLSHYLAKRYDEVLIGDYDPSFQGQAFSPHAHKAHRSMVNDCVIGQVRRITDWVCEKSGKSYQTVDEHYSTKTCTCGVRNETLTPKDRTWTCGSCNRDHLRDELSSRNHLVWNSKDEGNKLRCSRHYEHNNVRRCTLTWDIHRMSWVKEELNHI